MKSISSQPDVADRIRHSFPVSMKEEVSAVLDIIPTALHSPSDHDIGPVTISGEQLHIPCRFYSEVPANFNLADLEPSHQIIFSCIYSRHHNGYVRQEYIGHVLSDVRPWVVPFLLQVAGEYVSEITELILARLPKMNRDLCAQFAAENPSFIALTRRRIISYWNVYYRSRFPFFTDYPSYQMMNALDLWCDSLSPRLLLR